MQVEYACAPSLVGMAFPVLEISLLFKFLAKISFWTMDYIDHGFEKI